MKKLALALCLLLTIVPPVVSQESGYERIGDFTKESNVIFNDQLRRTVRRLRDIESGVSLTTGVTGILPLANGGTAVALVDPDADRILFWDDSEGKFAFLTVSTGLDLTTTNLTATPTLTSAGHTNQTSILATTNITIQSDKNYIMYYRGKSHASTDAEIFLTFDDSEDITLSNGVSHDAGEEFGGVIHFNTIDDITFYTITGWYETTADVITDYNTSFFVAGANTSVEISAGATMQSAAVTVYELSIN